jgi:hypothetical protein
VDRGGLWRSRKSDREHRHGARPSSMRRRHVCAKEMKVGHATAPRSTWNPRPTSPLSCSSTLHALEHFAKACAPLTQSCPLLPLLSQNLSSGPSLLSCVDARMRWASSHWSLGIDFDAPTTPSSCRSSALMTSVGRRRGMACRWQFVKDMRCSQRHGRVGCWGRPRRAEGGLWWTGAAAGALRSRRRFSMRVGQCGACCR